jgi:glycosyltransferase involved in cell wall biosynthesis
MRRADGRDVVVLVGQMWHDRWPHTAHHVTEALVPDHRVLFVEANYSWPKLVLGAATRRFPVAPLGWLRSGGGALSLLTPPPRLPWRHFSRRMGAWNQAMLAAWVRRAIDRAGMREPLIWNFLPQAARLRGALGESAFLYHCVDDWPLLLGAARLGDPAQVAADEEATARAADLVLCTARSLEERLAGWSRPVRRIPNGADVDLFAQALHPGTAVPPELAALPGPRIGFLGAPEKKVDAALVEAVARARPGWSFAFVGDLGGFPGWVRLRRLPNVHGFRPRPQAELPGWLRGMDAAWIPFLDTPLTRAVSPLKLYEYLAAGRPVVATDLPEARGLGDLVSRASGADAFVAALDAAIATGAEDRWRRADAARVFSWKNRTTEMLAAAGDLLSGGQLKSKGVRTPGGS